MTIDESTFAIAQKQLEELMESNPRMPSAAEIDEVIGQYFDMKCDHCSEVFKSLQQAEFHYKQEHDSDEGHIKCCGYSFRGNSKIANHVLWHLNPNIYMYVQNF